MTLPCGIVRVDDYDPVWPALFQAEAALPARRV